MFMPLMPVLVAQITPDQSLGMEQSIVIQDIPVGGELIDRIDGGAIRRANLFHSFSEFNIDEGQRVYFRNPNAVDHIFSRVTGTDPSNIFGILGVEGPANLFFMNPNGILFGRNAELDLNGSFAATTADGIQFGEQGVFSAIAPDTPSSLLTVDPSAFLFSQLGAGEIVNQSNRRGSAGISPSGRGDLFGLRVPDGETLLLLGGDVTADGGGLVVFNGQIEIGSVASIGAVELDVENNSLSLNFPNDLDWGDVTLDNRAGFLATTSTTGRDLTIHADNINILNGSGIFLGIETGIQNPAAQAGDIRLNAQEDILISGNSRVQNIVARNASGNSGNIAIDASSVVISNGGRIDANIGKHSGGLNFERYQHAEYLVE